MLLMALSTLCFGVMHASVRIMPKGLHGFEVAFFRNLFGMLVLVPWFVRLGAAPLRTQKIGLHALRGLLNTSSTLLFFVGVTLTPLAQVAAIGFTSPLFASFLAVFVLREPSRISRWLAMAVGFAGTVIVLRPGTEAFGTGPLLLLGAAVLWALSLIDIKVLSRTDSSITITTYMTIFLTPLSGIAALTVWQWPTWHQTAWLLLIGVLGNVGQVTLTQALKETDASLVLPLDFLKLIWGSVLGFLAFTEIPDGWTWLGGTVIFASTTYLTVRASREGRGAAAKRQ
jgi:drug/metabolite transporter (DMT)-like permease